MAVKPLIGFGIAIIGAGFFWKLFEDTINNYLIGFISDPADKYFLLSDMVWDALPILIVLVGIVLLIYGGMSSATSNGED